MITLHNPHLLWLLALLPLLALWLGRQGAQPAVVYSSIAPARVVARVTRSRWGRVLQIARWLGVALLIVALARPQLGHASTEVDASGVDLVLAVDVSGSMQALDLAEGDQARSRLEVVKSVVAKFIRSRPNDRIALVAFAGEPYLVSPLTLDHDWLLQNLQRLQPGMIQDGTAIGSALAASVNRLRGQPSKSRLVVLLTDGQNNAGQIQPQLAAEAARALGVKVYTIGVGGKGEAPMPITDEHGRTRMVMTKVDVDEGTLKKIADTTGAAFYRATDADSLERIYGAIDKLEKTTRKLKKYEHHEERFAWLLFPALALLAGEIALGLTRFKRIP
ncbi:MAG TPA: VWA domain-containing protein [Polyangia bacterium]|jgi:Ca-activated chloride channel family protein|nr:VWA domain-containing protein [Polyangia bacterium]